MANDSDPTTLYILISGASAVLLALLVYILKQRRQKKPSQQSRLRAPYDSPPVVMYQVAENLRDLFKKYDKNQSHSLTEDEFALMVEDLARRQHLPSYEFPDPDVDVPSIMLALDENSDGSVDEEEWVKWVCSGMRMTSAERTKFASQSDFNCRMDNLLWIIEERVGFDPAASSKKGEKEQDVASTAKVTPVIASDEKKSENNAEEAQESSAPREGSNAFVDWASDEDPNASSTKEDAQYAL